MKAIIFFFLLCVRCVYSQEQLRLGDSSAFIITSLGKIYEITPCSKTVYKLDPNLAYEAISDSLVVNKRIYYVSRINKTYRFVEYNYVLNRNILYSNSGAGTSNVYYNKQNGKVLLSKPKVNTKLSAQDEEDFRSLNDPILKSADRELWDRIKERFDTFYVPNEHLESLSIAKISSSNSKNYTVLMTTNGIVCVIDSKSVCRQIQNTPDNIEDICIADNGNVYFLSGKGMFKLGKGSSVFLGNADALDIGKSYIAFLKADTIFSIEGTQLFKCDKHAFSFVKYRRTAIILACSFLALLVLFVAGIITSYLSRTESIKDNNTLIVFVWSSAFFICGLFIIAAWLGPHTAIELIKAWVKEKIGK